MKIVAFNGSPKAENGNTDVLVQAFLQGAQQAGAEVETVYLIQKTIHHCQGCFCCWFRTPGKCVYADDMGELLAKYKSADIVCFATPVYTWNMTAALKNFIDRLAPLKSPLLVQSEGNFDLKDTQIKTARFVVIANAGFPGENNFGTLKQVFASCNPVLEIYRNCGMALKKQDVRVKDYLACVTAAGFEMVANGRLSEQTQHNLQRDLMPLQEYIGMLQM